MPNFSRLSSRPALAFTTADLAAIMTECFRGYVVPLTLTAEQFDSRFRRENLDLLASRVMMDNERPVAIILVARRGWSARIAAMGIVPEHRAKGLGQQILKEVIDDLRRIGDQRLLLEVVESNEPALRLYRGLGFSIRRRLIGYSRAARTSDALSPDHLTEVDPITVARKVGEEGEVELPWIMAPETLAAAAAPARGFALSDCAFAICEPLPQPSSVALRTLVVPRSVRGHGFGRRMISSLTARYPGQNLVISANFPEELASGFLTHMDFERTPISQFEMSLSLGA